MQDKRRAGYIEFTSDKHPLVQARRDWSEHLGDFEILSQFWMWLDKSKHTPSRRLTIARYHSASSSFMKLVSEDKGISSRGLRASKTLPKFLAIDTGEFERFLREEHDKSQHEADEGALALSTMQEALEDIIKRYDLKTQVLAEQARN